MSQNASQDQYRARTFPSPLWAFLGCGAVLALHYFVDARVPGGAIGGAIGGLLGAIVGLVIRSLRNK